MAKKLSRSNMQSFVSALTGTPMETHHTSRRIGLIEKIRRIQFKPIYIAPAMMAMTLLSCSVTFAAEKPYTESKTDFSYVSTESAPQSWRYAGAGDTINYGTPITINTNLSTDDQELAKRAMLDETNPLKVVFDKPSGSTTPIEHVNITGLTNINSFVFFYTDTTISGTYKSDSQVFEKK